MWCLGGQVSSTCCAVHAWLATGAKFWFRRRTSRGRLSPAVVSGLPKKVNNYSYAWIPVPCIGGNRSKSSLEAHGFQAGGPNMMNKFINVMFAIEVQATEFQGGFTRELPNTEALWQHRCARKRVSDSGARWYDGDEVASKMCYRIFSVSCGVQNLSELAVPGYVVRGLLQIK